MSEMFVVALGPLLKIKVELNDEAISWKQGVRAKMSVPLADVLHFGHRRLADGANGMVELVFVSRGAAKKHPKLPINPADRGTQDLLARLAERLPEADTSRLSWLDAAPLLGMKPFGVGAYLRYPLFGAGLVLMLLAGPASMIARKVFDSEMRYQGIAVAVVMAIGLGMMVVGWRRVRAEQRAEEEAKARRGG